MAQLMYRLFGKHRARRRWAEWAPFIVVALLAVGVLLTLALTSPIFRPLPIPGPNPAAGFPHLSGSVESSALSDSTRAQPPPEDKDED
jgi:hypothetical protein